jgi:GT2 family glycosyltransferase
VSIVIPAHNKVEVTYFALCSLLLAYNHASFEVIVVDDASSDETAELESYVGGITVIRNEVAQRFIRACNAGAEKARGKYILLLNNDVEVTAHWLDELIAAFDRFDDVGLAGSRLLYPDGTLQDAGGVIWGSGNPWNYGKGQNPDDPRFSYARQADYLSGAAMMVPTRLWREVGGLSTYLEPMYFEDTDFAFKIREAGYTTWYIPSSVVYHYEGMTSGTDTSGGFKKFQEVNRPKFKRRWAKAYAGHGREGMAPDLEKDRGVIGNVLFIDCTTPRPDRDAGSYAAVQEMRLVQSLGYKVSFLPTNMAHFGHYTEDLQKAGVEMIFAPFFLSPLEYLEKHAADFDAVYITRYYVARDVLDVVRRTAPDAKVLFNNADLHFLREMRAASASNSETLMTQARTTRDMELEVIRKVDVALSYNEVEHSVIQAYTEGGTPVVKCPWVVDTVESVAPLSGRTGMSFLGNYLHHPNAEGVTWFVRDVMPVIMARAGRMPLWIYGSGMTDEIRRLRDDVVHPEGFIADMADAYDRHRIFVAPLLSGAGIKGKVLAALARGTPCILTPTAAEGIGLRHKHDCFIATTPEGWAEAVRMLNEDDALWERISANALSYMREAYSFDVGRARMREAFETVDMFQSLD